MSRVDDKDQQAADPLLQQKIDSVNQASALARTFYTFLMLITLYIAVTINQTDHLDLLFLHDVNLPIVDIGVSIRSFYIFMPWIYLLLHINLLILFVIIADKYLLLSKHLQNFSHRDRQSYRKMLHSFFLTQYLSKQHDGWLQMLLALILWVTACLLPTYMLLWMQFDFLPAQFPAVLASQRLCIFFSVLANLILFNRMMRSMRKARWPKGYRQSVSASVRSMNFVPAALLVYAWLMSYFVVDIPLSDRQLGWASMFDAGQCAFNYETSDNDQEAIKLPAVAFSDLLFGFDKGESASAATILRGLDSYRGGLTKSCRAKVPGLASLIGLAVKSSLNPFDAAFWFDGHNLFSQLLGFKLALEIPAETIIVGNPDELSTEDRNYFRQHKDQSDRDQSQIEEYEIKLAIVRAADFLTGDHQGRQFNLANFAGGIFLKEIKLSSLRFRGTNLIRAELQGVNLVKTQLQGADLRYAQLQGAQLQGADLSEAQLHGADLIYAQLQGAFLYGAQLQGATLNLAELQGANLRDAQLQGANLRDAQLQGADLRDAQLQGVVLMRSHLRGKYKLKSVEQAYFMELGNQPWSEEEYHRVRDVLTSLGNQHKPVLDRLQAAFAAPDFIRLEAEVVRNCYQVGSTNFSISLPESCESIEAKQIKALRPAYTKFWLELLCQQKDISSQGVKGWVQGAFINSLGEKQLHPFDRCELEKSLNYIKTNSASCPNLNRIEAGIEQSYQSLGAQNKVSREDCQ